jgi:hypothetical protein
MLEIVTILCAALSAILLFPMVEPYIWRIIRAIKRRRRWQIRV